MNEEEEKEINKELLNKLIQNEWHMKNELFILKIKIRSLLKDINKIFKDFKEKR